MRVLIRGLPNNNKNLLFYLMQFLSKVANNSDFNKMTPTNLATCWAPNLLKNETETTESMVMEGVHACSVIACLIENIDFMAQDLVRHNQAATESKQVVEHNPPPELKRQPSELEIKDGLAQGWLLKQGGSVKVKLLHVTVELFSDMETKIFHI